MATVIGNLTPAFLLSRLGNSRPCVVKLRPCTAPVFRRSFAAITARAASTAFIEVEPTDTNPIVVQNEVTTSSNNILACPICFDQFSSSGDPGLSVDSASGSSFQCSTCKKTYFGNQTHIDLTTASGSKNYGESMPVSTELFRTPLVSFLYERGWRQSFSVWGGFPGPEKEFELTKDFLKPVLGGNIIDAKNMLKQTYEFIKKEENFPEENIILVRADISRLPFATSSVDAVHAGAALHCWPSPSTAVAEISRVLRPGGVFVATTYILDGPLSYIPFLRNITQRTKQISGSQIFTSERELEDLCQACGLVGYTCVRNGLFVMISATKPS
ncbi:putative methyltransferase [Prunus yedoensis var. nudiflora]|uniref:Putative methyltransferase n=1 Tax=Prunus yedoensis var. nudiflora TaxID=2094558 RepID=A0A314V2H3_PRUYE|nr:putative methyltransferase [Prunus yedoensis var. nudiflora]